MHRRWNLFVRLAGATALAVAGYGAGATLLETPQVDSFTTIQSAAVLRLLFAVSFALFGFALGYLFTPRLLRPLDAAYRDLREIPPATLTAGTLGLIIGLLVSTLLALPLSFLPDPFGAFLPFIAAVGFAFLGTAVVASDPRTYLSILRGLVGDETAPEAARRYVLLDTSVIIDGRIADVAETGFIDATLLVPRFVLAELQHIADSSDALRRNRGRRGLDVLNRLQGLDAVEVEIGDQDIKGTHDVDRKLVRLADRLGCPVMTNDYNLNRVAEIEGIKVLNLNELANAVKTIVLPGETLEVRIIQEGKEYGQGVGYLDDGTMVVVDNARKMISKTIDIVVTSVLQTTAGKMIFGRYLEPGGAQAPAPPRAAAAQPVAPPAPVAAAPPSNGGK